MVSLAPILSRNKRSRRGRGGGNRNAQDHNSQYEYYWVWTCCSCWQHTGMITVTTFNCPGCVHARCWDCPLEQIEVPAEGQGKYSPAASATKRKQKGDPVDIALPLEILESAFQAPPSMIMEPQESTPPISSDTTPPVPSTSTTKDDGLIFAPHPFHDSALLEVWHRTILPSIASHSDRFLGLNAIHLLRQGISEEESSPTIIVSVDIEDEVTKKSLREEILKLFEEPVRPSLRVVFEQSSLRRTVGSLLPPICKPRNNSFQLFPQHGASIGIQHRVDCTASLGGYLIVDGQPYALTVDHIVPNDLANNGSISLTHPSEQESQDKPQWRRVSKHLQSLKDCCSYCYAIWKNHCNKTDFYKPVDLLSTGDPCAGVLDFQCLKHELFQAHPCNALGSMAQRSKTRSRSSIDDLGSYQIEMDWALVTLDKWQHPLKESIREASKGLHFSSIQPGAKVKSTGRTSGSQFGCINTARSAIRQGSRFTEEWTVIRDSKTTLKHWVEGGIGVQGDSGSWIIDQESGALYGMVWGRHREKTDPICLFSPILDVIADIKERTGAKTICLPADEKEDFDKEKEREVFAVPAPELIVNAHDARRFSSTSQTSFPQMISATGMR